MSQTAVAMNVEDVKKIIARGEAMQRLLNNPDFAEIVGEVYYKEEPARLAGLLGDIGGSYRWCPENSMMSLPPEQFVKMQKDIQNDIHAIGAFQAFVRIVLWKADGATQALHELENPPLVPEDESDEMPEA